MMTNSLTGGVTYQVNPTGSDITSFNPTSDQLEFGQISVHGLILGTFPDGTAAIVNPWADPVQSQSLQGLSWNDLDLDNFGIVGNEHLRQDIGGVLSWEQGIGPRQSDTVYVRSHQFGVQEVINDFDPQTQKLNFLYTGTRERLSVIDTEQGLMIRFEPTDQSILLAGVQRTDLIGANLEFHHDQVMEDNLEVPFGFSAEEVALVSRTGLLTPQAPAGESTDGDQVRAGLMVNPDSTVMAIDPAHTMHDHSMHEHVMAGDGMAVDGMAADSMAPMVMAPEIVPDVSGTAGLEASVAGTLYSGGMSGTLTLANTSDVAQTDWSISVLTNQPDFQSWSAESSVTDLGSGLYQVTLTPPAWGLEIPAAGSVGLAFNAGSVGLSDSGELTNEMFFVGSNSVAALVETPAVIETPEVVETPVVESSPVSDPPSGAVMAQGLSVSATINDGWSGTFAGEITVSNLGDTSAGTDWGVSFIADVPVTTASNFEVESVLRSDGRYNVSLAPKAWSAPLDAGASQASYYQAAGDARDPGEVFDFGESAATTTVSQPSSDAAVVETSSVVETPAVIETPEVVETPVVESSPVSDPPSGAVMAQGLSVSATINDGWSGTFAGEITVSNLGDTSAGTDWGVSFIADVPVTTASNFEVESVLRSDGRYNVSLAPKAWSAPLDAGASQASYYQAAGDARDPGEVFDFGESAATTTVSQPSSDAAVVETSSVVETPAVIETPEVVETPVVESSPVSDPPSGAVMAQGLSVSATINDGWSGTFAGEITVSNLGDTSAGTDWGVSFIADVPFTTASNFEVESVLRSDGRYNVSLAPKAWSAPLDAGASQASYYQAAGDARDPGEVFDFGESAATTTVSQPSSDAAVVETSSVVETPPLMEMPAVVDASPGASTDPVDIPVQASVDVVEAGDVAVDVQTPNGGSDKRIVTYFEEWGVYGRDVNLSDVNGQAMTHLNYSFFDVKADGSVQLFDSYAAQEKRFSASDQVSRTFTNADYQALDPALIAAYNSDKYTISESADLVTVTSVPVGWNDAGPKDAGNFEQLRRFKELNPNVEIGFALGGWTLSDEFSPAFASQAGRDQFTSDVVDIFQTYEFFNVVDFDWEYPGGGGDPGNASSSDDGANFALVLEQLRSELDAFEQQTGGHYEISIATAGGEEKLANLNLAGIDPYVDFYNVMTYDFHGGWENQTGHQAAMTGDANNYDVTSAVSVFEEEGVELNKVVLGAPAYTRAWGGVTDGGTFGYQQSGTGAEAEGSFEAGVYDYKDIVTDVITGQTDLYWDDNSKAAFTYNGDEWSSIETTATIAGKAAYVQEKDLGGMMFWALSNDAEGELSLVEAADDILRQGGSYSDAIENAPEFDYILGGNGEFSVSDFTALT